MLLSVESSSQLLWFYFTVLCDWFKKFEPHSQSMRNNTNHDLLARVFLHFMYMYQLHVLALSCKLRCVVCIHLL